MNNVKTGPPSPKWTLDELALRHTSAKEAVGHIAQLEAEVARLTQVGSLYDWRALAEKAEARVAVLEQGDPRPPYPGPIQRGREAAQARRPEPVEQEEPTCPDCEGSGVVKVEWLGYSNVKPCPCRGGEKNG